MGPAAIFGVVSEPDVAEIDLADLSAHERRWLQFLLQSAAIKHEVRGNALRFASVDRFVVEDSIVEARALDADPRPTDGLIDVDDYDDYDDGDGDDSMVVSGTIRRVGAGAVDSMIISLATLLIAKLADRFGLPAAGWIGFVVAEWCVVVVPIAVTGRPPGALVVGARVVRAVDDHVPGWWASTLRWTVAHLPVLVVGGAVEIGVSRRVLGILAVFQVAGLLAVYAGVFISRSRRGAHDVASGTIVVTEASWHGSSGPPRMSDPAGEDLGLDSGPSGGRD
jgi:uncharacterized RDD family membrane protein YckC